MPIGGLKEKLLAALRGGIKTVLIPEENEKDLAEIPDNVKAGAEDHPRRHVSEVLKLALVRQPEPIEWDEAAEEAAAPDTCPLCGPGAIAHRATGGLPRDRTARPRQTAAVQPQEVTKVATRKTRATPPTKAGEEASEPAPAPDPGDSDTGKAGPDAPPRAALRRKDFLELVATRAGSRKSDTRTVTDAALAVIAEALARGEDVVLPPLGRIRVVKRRDGDRSRVLTLRLSQQTGGAPSEDDPDPAGS
jgi:hypothetical protein